MINILDVWHYIQSNWFQIIIDATAALNVMAAGSRVMGWTWISDECGKVEQAISAMVQAALNRRQQNFVDQEVLVNKEDINAFNVTPMETKSIETKPTDNTGA